MCVTDVRNAPCFTITSGKVNSYKDATSVLDIGVGPGLALRYVMLQNPHLSFAGVDVRDLRLPR